MTELMIYGLLALAAAGALGFIAGRWSKTTPKEPTGFDPRVGRVRGADGKFLPK